MSQSELHRELVLQVMEALQGRYPRTSFIADVQQVPGEAVPPKVGGHRPDVYGYRNSFADAVVIGEAKTDGDLDNRHTYDQVVSYIAYLEQRVKGGLVLSVTGCAADHAKTLLRFILRDLGKTYTDIAVFDGCDFWLLDPNGGRIWHLD